MNVKTRYRVLVVSMLSMIVLLAAMVVPVQAGENKPTPPPSHAYGKSLSEWMRLHVEYQLGGPDHVGNVRFIKVNPDPTVPGDQVVCDQGDSSFDKPTTCTGVFDLTLDHENPFVLPFSAWLGETYKPELGQPDDTRLERTYLTRSNILITLDGEPIVDSEKDDLNQYYFDFTLDPPIFYSEATSYGSIGIIWGQGIGFVHPPLAVGQHILTLHSELFLEKGVALPVSNYPDGIGAIWKNTWNITVTN